MVNLWLFLPAVLVCIGSLLSSVGSTRSNKVWTIAGDEKGQVRLDMAPAALLAVA
jgi:hypothetical protein